MTSTTVTVASEAGKKEPNYAVPALDKALDVIELLAAAKSPMNQAEISRALDRNPNELFRILNALAARNYLRRTDGGRFRLSLKLFELSHTHSPYEELLRVALPAMRELSETLSESCHLSMIRDGEVLIMAQVESPNPIRLSIEVGSRHSLLNTTSGRVLLSSMGTDERNQYLEHSSDFSSRSEESRDIFITRLHSIRERGFELTDGERFVGGLDVGALVGTATSRVKAALVVSTLRHADGPDVTRIADVVCDTVLQIAVESGVMNTAMSPVSKNQSSS
ncbi:IclR family transcriptional regulator [Granulosicoccus antarcticus]|uniref:Transcriptional regulator KdgR n=1 Tax=Granulosicoccus antarcticus IMCC3135 TaxID=1192854 RepID=A0A2Z2P1Z5_9GAMM|nr:IclR family transcriptional regulator [Granulosicoccus antarcticus]ASJ76278.1 Transcriptional regulator KdgR [Granulosicoccus antarcticus IMCC3135]